MSGHIILVFVIIAFLALLNKKWGLLVSFALLIWMLSFRTNEIPDTEIYQWMYDDPISRLDYNEIGFLFLGIGFKMATGAEFIVFYLSLVGVCLALWYFGSKKILPDDEHFGMLFLIFLSFFGFFYLGITIRNCLSEVLILCGLGFFLRLKGWKRIFFYLLFVVLAMFIHRSAAFFLLLLPLIRVKISTSGYYRIFALCVILWLLSGSALSRGIVGEISKLSMFSKLDNYSSSAESAPSMLSLQILINWIVSYFAIRSQNSIETKYRSIYNYFLKINMMGLFTLSVIWSVPTSYRFYNMFFFFNFILIYLIIFHNNRITKKKSKSIYSLSISAAYFAILLHSFSFLLLY